MKTRRAFLKHFAAGVIAAPWVIPALARERARRKRLAIVTTEWRFPSHIWQMGERFFVAYPSGGAAATRQKCAPLPQQYRKADKHG